MPLPNLGLQLNGLPRVLDFERDLEVFDVPILTELKAKKSGEAYLRKWIAWEGGLARSLVVRSEQLAIAKYLARRITMLELLRDPNDGAALIVDYEGEAVRHVSLVHVDMLPASYLPKSSVKHDPALRPEWELVTQNFLLGENWKTKSIADIETRYKNTCAFAYLTQQGTGESLPEQVLSYKYDRGFPVVSMFRETRESLPASRQPKSTSLSAHSPGVLAINTPIEVAEPMMKALRAVPAARNAYEGLQSWAKLRTENVEEVPKTARTDLKRLAGRLGVDVEKLLRSGSKKSLLTAAKILTSYYRQLVRLLQPKDDEDIEFLEAADITKEYISPVRDEDYEDEVA